uniref:Uncharacterized protein n=1 Tax=Molossus molossus TaxID=27622 RepID=A0A7J8F8V8_MOLMO|nr:hypothetical protein HJG59_008504 [Molossus molossus]
MTPTFRSSSNFHFLLNIIFFHGTVAFFWTLLFINKSWALASLAQRLERWPAVLRDPGSVPAKGTYFGCSLSPALVGRAGGSHSMCPFTSMFLSLSPFLSLPPTLSVQKMEKYPRVRIKKKKSWIPGFTHKFHPALPWPVTSAI